MEELVRSAAERVVAPGGTLSLLSGMDFNPGARGKHGVNECLMKMLLLAELKPLVENLKTEVRSTNRYQSSDGTERYLYTDIMFVFEGTPCVIEVKYLAPSYIHGIQLGYERESLAVKTAKMMQKFKNTELTETTEFHGGKEDKTLGDRMVSADRQISHFLSAAPTLVKHEAAAFIVFFVGPRLYQVRAVEY